MIFTATLRLLMICLLGTSCTFSTTAFAHDRSESFSEWTWQGHTLRYTYSVLQREVTRLPESQQTESVLATVLAQYLGKRITVAVAGQTCSAESHPAVLNSREGYLHIEGGFRCTDSGTPTVSVDTFFDLQPTHTHYAKVRSEAQIEEFLLTQDRRSHTLLTPGLAQEDALGGWEAFSQYLAIGAKHILAGADHLAFLFGLILLARGWREMAWLITGFTLGHSVSLALAVLGVAQPNGVMVEALIGFTIVLVAIEVAGERSGRLSHTAPWLFLLCLLLSVPVWLATLQWELVLGTAAAGLFSFCYLRLVAVASTPGALRLLVTSTFGVIHGFGFAGGLLESNFPVSDVAFVLLGFNLGVELGQLMVLVGVFVPLLFVRRFASKDWLQRGANAAVAILGGLGTYWFVSRLVG